VADGVRRRRWWARAARPGRGAHPHRRGRLGGRSGPGLAGRDRAGQAPSRTQVATALENLFTFAATIAQAIPEVQTLAETISTWRAEIARGVLTGYTNAAAEGTNRLVKLVYRTAFGFTNVTNQQRRSRYTASRSTRPEWLPTVTATPSPSVVT